MDSFIFYGDYAKQIQSDNLTQIIGGNQTILDSVQTAAVEECMSYLRQKYDISKSFQPTYQHDKAKTYQAGQTVYLNASAYDATKTYAVGDQTLQDSNIYTCSTAITSSESFTKSRWSLLGAQHTTFNSIVPNDLFDNKLIYSAGDKIFWEGKTYTCKLPTRMVDHETRIQINQASSPDIINIFPNDPIKGAQYWGAGSDYVIPTNTPITNTVFWQPGDARDQKLLEACIKIVIYHAHIRISPRNIPELREINYIGQKEDRILSKGRVIYPVYSAIGWLQAASTGTDIIPQLPMIQPAQGRRISFGGNSKLINQY